MIDDGIPIEDTRFFYDGWNLLYELDLLSTAPSRRYVWGLDLSQSLQGAGGVGGLLLTESDGVSHAVTYDANGNISEYIDLNDGEITAHLEYDAFGRTIAMTGTRPATFGFSTKYQDTSIYQNSDVETQTGYYYYGFRYYDPETGRWPNRDPIGERGGVNLYAFVWNNGFNWIDPFGHAGIPPIGARIRPNVSTGVMVLDTSPLEENLSQEGECECRPANHEMSTRQTRLHFETTTFECCGETTTHSRTNTYDAEVRAGIIQDTGRGRCRNVGDQCDRYVHIIPGTFVEGEWDPPLSCDTDHASDDTSGPSDPSGPLGGGYAMPIPPGIDPITGRPPSP